MKCSCSQFQRHPVVTYRVELQRWLGPYQSIQPWDAGDAGDAGIFPCWEVGSGFPRWVEWYPLVMSTVCELENIEHGHWFIMDLPMISMVDLSSSVFVNVDQAGYVLPLFGFVGWPAGRRYTMWPPHKPIARPCWGMEHLQENPDIFESKKKPEFPGDFWWFFHVNPLQLGKFAISKLEICNLSGTSCWFSGNVGVQISRYGQTKLEAKTIETWWMVMDFPRPNWPKVSLGVMSQQCHQVLGVPFPESGW